MSGKNLSTSAHTNVEVRHCYDSKGVTFVSATDGGTDQAASACPDAFDREVLWSIAEWQPGEEFSHSTSASRGVSPSDSIGVTPRNDTTAHLVRAQPGACR